MDRGGDVMIDLNPSAFKRADAAQDILAAIDVALVADAETQARREYLGASSIGAPCERRVQFEYMGLPADPGYRPEARTQRIFARGHMMEDLAIGWLTSAGFTVRTRREDGSQFGFSAAEGRFKGHVDGVILSGPGIKTPCLWEHKAVGQKSWAAMAKNGIAKAKPEYADQIAVYKAYLDLTAPALFQATNCDTMEIYLELVPFDRKRAQAASDRAVAIIQDTEAGALRPRPTDDADFWLCRSCPFRERCWG
jgi:hypothetical protein